MKNLLKNTQLVSSLRPAEISCEYKEAFTRELMKLNIMREKLLSIILIFIDLALLCIDVCVSDFWTKDVHIFGKFADFHVLLLILPSTFLLFVFIGDKIKIGNVWFYKAAHLLLLTAVLAFCALIGVNNVINNKQPFAYIVAIFCIASLILLKNYEIWLMYIFSYLIYIMDMVVMDSNFSYWAASCLFPAVLIIMAFVISHINYSSFTKNFIGREMILKKNAELEEMSALLRAQQEASLDAILVVGANKQILSYNHQFIELWNIPEENKKLNDSKALLQYILQNIVDGEMPIHRMEELCTSPQKSSRSKIQLRNGNILDKYSAPILLSRSKVCGRVWYFRDITETEKMDEALRKSAEENEKLLRKTMKYDELKSQFLANISHEFRTPLNVLLGTLQLMNKQKACLQDLEIREKVFKYICIMKQNCYRLLRLTNNLIDLTRLDTGFLEIHLQNCNIVQIVEDITVSVAEYVKNKGIRLVFDTDVEEKIIAVDIEKIEKIMLNLLSNAVKFTGEKGSIQINFRDKGEKVEVSVRDTGIGIQQDKLDIIFERFRQADSSLSRSCEGSGIGLSLIKNLVELHGGNITVTSEVNRGSEFTVELPCKTLCEEQTGKPAAYDSQSFMEKVSIEFSDIYSN